MKFTGRSRIAHRNTLAALLLGGLLLLALAGLAVFAHSASAGAERNHSADERRAGRSEALPRHLEGELRGKGFCDPRAEARREGRHRRHLNNFDIGRDKNGNLDDDTHIDFGDGPILNVHVKSGALYFVAIQKDQYSPSTEWKFVPKTASEGELTQMLDGQPYSPNGSVPKPILMLRDHPKP